MLQCERGTMEGNGAVEIYDAVAFPSCGWEYTIYKTWGMVKRDG